MSVRALSWSDDVSGDVPEDLDDLLELFGEDFSEGAFMVGDPDNDRRARAAVLKKFPPDWGHGEGPSFDFPRSERGKGCACVERWPFEFLVMQLAAGVVVRPYFMTLDFGPRWWDVMNLRSRLFKLVRSGEKSAGGLAGCLFGVVGVYSMAVVLPDDQLERRLPLVNVGRGLMHRLSMLLFSRGELNAGRLDREWMRFGGLRTTVRPIPVDGGERSWICSDGAELVRGGLELAIARVIGRGFNGCGQRVRVFPFGADHAQVFFHGDLKSPMFVDAGS